MKYKVSYIVEETGFIYVNADSKEDALNMADEKLNKGLDQLEYKTEYYTKNYTANLLDVEELQIIK